MMGKNQELKRLALQSIVFSIDAVRKEIEYVQENNSDLHEKIIDLSSAIQVLAAAYVKIERGK